METVKISIKRLTNGEILTFLDDVARLVRAKNSDDFPLLIIPQMESLETSIAQMRMVYHLNRKSDKTNLLGELDSDRGNCWLGMRDILQAHSQYHLDKSIREKAEAVLEVVLRYGKRVDMQNYQEETSSLLSLIDEIEKESDFVNTLASLQLTEWFNMLKEKNNQFRQTYIERDIEASEKPKEKFADLRITGEEAYKALTVKLSAYSEIEGGVYEEIVIELNSLIERYKSLTITNKKGSTIAAEEEGNMTENELSEVSEEENTNEEAGTSVE